MLAIEFQFQVFKQQQQKNGKNTAMKNCVD